MDKGVIPWRRPWSAESGMPINIRGTGYRGINVWLLASLGYESPTFLTFKQARAAGGSVRKGEKGCPVVFWKQLNIEDKATGEARRIPMLRGYTVFNVAQCDGVEDPAASDLTPKRSINPIESAEKIAANYSGAPNISHGGGRAFYNPATDSVTLPERDSFDESEFYYATMFHEYAHSTGHRNRLARDGVTNHASFGDHRYAREELVAEFTSSYLCGVAGIEKRETIENSAAYLQGWRAAIKRDPKALVTAAAQAQRAADWIQGTRYEKGSN